MQLRDGVAVISGGSRGIGLAIAKAYAKRGAHIILLGRNAETLTKAKNMLDVQYNQEHETHCMDVSQNEAWVNLMRSIRTPSVLVNAAGVTHYSLLPRTPVGIIEEVVNTNLMGSIYAAKAFSKTIIGSRTSADQRHVRREGCIINISSALAFRGGSGSSVYAASKAGMIGFTKALAEEFGPRGIRVNAIAPGYIDTDMVSGMAAGLREQTLQRTGVRRMGTPEEVASAAVFLAENDFANGTTLTLDGGLVYE